MLQVKNLTITHKKDLHQIVKDFSFVLNDGDKAAIIGEEGNGKSTLLKLIAQEELIDSYAEYSGEIIRNGARIGLLAQELTKEEQKMTVTEYLSQQEEYHHITYKDLALYQVQLNLEPGFAYSDQLIDSLSGGEKVKLQMLRILIMNPDILLLDEPSNDIDLEMLSWLEHFIQKCRVPILYISHDETLLENTANLIIHMEQIMRKTVPQITVVRMGYQEYVETRMNHLERQTQEAKKDRSEYEKQQEKLRRIQQKVDYQQETITRQNPHAGKMLKKKMHVVKSMEKRFEKQYENMTQVPDTEDAIFIKFGTEMELPNGKRIIDLQIDELNSPDRCLARNIHLEMIGPRKLCIVGKNGIGKTTLIKKIAKNLLERKDIKAYYMPQNYEDLLDYSSSPIEFLSNSWEKEEQVRICTYLGSMKFTRDEMNHSIGELSGGQKAKLLLLKMSMEGVNVLILDEPTRNFSPLSNPVIRKLLSEYRGAIISVSHDRKYIGEVCDTVYELTKDGLIKKDIISENKL